MNDTIKKHDYNVREAEGEYAAALDKAKELRASRQKKIQEAIRAQQAELADLKAKREAANDERGEAIINGDTKKEAELDEQIKAIDREIAETEQKIEAVGKRSTAQTEKDAVRLAVSEFRDFVKVCEEEKEKLRKYAASLEAQIANLAATLEDAEAAIRRISDSSGNNYKADELVSIYETTLGAIDVSGHSCGDEKNAKRRFIRGSVRGLEKTPAAALLEDEED